MGIVQKGAARGVRAAREIWSHAGARIVASNWHHFTQKTVLISSFCPTFGHFPFHETLPNQNVYSVVYGVLPVFDVASNFRVLYLIQRAFIDGTFFVSLLIRFPTQLSTVSILTLRYSFVFFYVLMFETY